MSAPEPSGSGPRILLVMLEFASWRRARAWGYSGNFGLEEGLRAAGAQCVVLPALAEVPSAARHSWLRRARETLAGERFDQVWVWLVHQRYDPAFWQWVQTLAPVVVGLVFESLEHTADELVRFPHFAERERFVEGQLRQVTHALAVDERDVAQIEQRLGIPARWLPTAVPRRCILPCDEVSSQAAAVFYGAPYGQRQRWLEEPLLAGLLVHGGDAEAGTTIAERHEALHLRACDYLLAGQSPDRVALDTYVDACRAVRREAFDHWLQQLRRWPVSVNLPSVGKIYTSRVIEAMAAGRPAISWRIPERPRNLALFAPEREILLYETPAQLAGQVQQVLASPRRAHELALAAQRKLWQAHTVEEQAADILGWLAGRDRYAAPAPDSFERFERLLGAGQRVEVSAEQRRQAALRRLAAAERAAVEGRTARAIQIVEALITWEPELAGVHRVLAQLLAQGGAPWQATGAFERGLRRHPAALELLLPALEHAVKCGDVERALRFAARAYRLASDQTSVGIIARQLSAAAGLLHDEAQPAASDELASDGLADRDAGPSAAGPYQLPATYRARLQVAQHDDRAYADEWQDEVYARARRELDRRGGRRVLDIGCGSGFKLLKHFADCETVGMELSPAYDYLLWRYPERCWLKSSLARPLSSPVDIVIVSDVIEHLPEPERLLRFLGSFRWKAAILSTPERDLLGTGDAGPPENPCHAREWSSAEFCRYLRRHFVVADHEVCNREQATQLVVLEQRARSALSVPRSDPASRLDAEQGVSCECC